MTTLTLNPIDDGIFAAPQLLPDWVATLAEAGYRTLINNRPDHEGGTAQPTHAQIEQAAQSAGMAAHHIPVIPGQISVTQAQALNAALAGAERPVVLFCRSGSRSAALYRLAQELAARGE